MSELPVNGTGHEDGWAGEPLLESSERGLDRRAWPPCGVRFVQGGAGAVVRTINMRDWLHPEHWDLMAGVMRGKVRLPGDVSASAAWDVAPDGERVLACAGDGTLHLLDLSGAILVRCTFPPGMAGFLCSEQPGLGSRGCSIAPDGTRTDNSCAHPAYTKACDLGFDASGARAAVAYGQCYAVVWDVASGRPIRVVGGSTVGARIFRVTPPV